MPHTVLALLASALAAPATHGAAVFARDLGVFPGAPVPAAEAALAAVDVAPLDPTAVRPWRGRERVRFRQTHGGVPVLGAGAVVQREADGRVSALSARTHAGLTVDPAPRVPAAAAEATARAAAPTTDRVLRRDLWVVADGDGGRLVWQVHLRGPDPTDAWRVQVDAHSGRVRAIAPDGAHARGRVFGRRAVPEELIEVELADLLPEAAGLSGDTVTVTSQAFEGDAEVRTSWAAPDASGDFLYDPDHSLADDGFAEVHAYHHVQQTWRYFHDTFDHPVPDRVEVTVNYTGGPGAAYDNAYFTYGDGGIYTLTFGQGRDMDWSYDPGIVIHEFGHGVVDDVIGLLDSISYPFNMDEHGLHPAPGGLTEGLPDYWSTTRNDRSTQAEFADGSPIRDSDNDATCPGSILGEAHADGVIIGGTTWDIRQALGADVSDPVVYGAMGLLTPTASYADFAAALVAATEALVADGAAPDDAVETVQGIVDARGLSTCGRAVPVDADTPATMTWLGADIIDPAACVIARNAGIQLTPPFQVTWTAPAAPAGQRLAGVALSVALDGPVTEADDLQYALVATTDPLVRFRVEELSLLGMTFPLPREPDNAVWMDENNPTAARLSAADLGLDALAPGDTVTFALAGMNCVTTRATVTATPVFEAAPPAGGEEDGKGGCGGGGAAVALLPLALLGIRRRTHPL